ncbi:tryptophan synthase subunit alpha [Megalodesulfovibrio gigas]|uniref:Tryptophan synthase alpha chain n=1 Tax=Megalodesulfovibrio gigas (strain ATCC 19364 / DSM 1382 / NCIMB 9332 / VKM B-1759) TaxID=1121448 RepID=T2G8Q0_MEGG1|nr:tryptophan synthase subunit alpha [Megalodesulfovibrio gigas]AGW12511.1 putative Tryptophan synthase alpha chain [Megalodesulfovibrio gigas DSM 1382 = ATCC 19364]
MSAPSRLEAAIRAATATGRPALIPFLPAGYPDKDRFWTELAALDAHGADVIEIGVPFSDPVADGPVVEAASLECLEAGVTLAWILAELKARAAAGTAPKAPLVLMGYANPFLQYGLAALAADAAAGGVAGMIIPDLPYEERGPFQDALAAAGVDLIPLIGLNTSPERMRLYADNARGFAYLVSVMGVTGERDTLPEPVKAQLAVAREIFPVPVALGFGISRPEQLQDLPADAAIFGSALIRHIKAGGDAAGFMARWQ